MSEHIADIYCRAATDDGKAKQLDEQEQSCREYCEANGMTVGMCFREVISGLSSPDRPFFNKLRERIRSGAIQSIVIYRLDRFSRKLEYKLMLVDEIRHAGVILHIVSDKDNPIPDLERLQQQTSVQGTLTLIQGSRLRGHN